MSNTTKTEEEPDSEFNRGYLSMSIGIAKATHAFFPVTRQKLIELLQKQPVSPEREAAISALEKESVGRRRIYTLANLLLCVGFLGFLALDYFLSPRYTMPGVMAMFCLALGAATIAIKIRKRLFQRSLDSLLLYHKVHLKGRVPKSAELDLHDWAEGL